MSRHTYPATVAECLDGGRRFKRATHAALATFARAKPWRGSLGERAQKLVDLHAALCAAYRIDCKLTVHVAEGAEPGTSGGSYFSPRENRIYLVGRLSVVTYLHEFAHALGHGERGACRWSLNLFKRHFPRSYARCRHDGHMLVTDGANSD